MLTTFANYMFRYSPTISSIFTPFNVLRIEKFIASISRNSSTAVQSNCLSRYKIVNRAIQDKPGCQLAKQNACPLSVGQARWKQIGRSSLSSKNCLYICCTVASERRANKLLSLLTMEPRVSNQGIDGNVPVSLISGSGGRQQTEILPRPVINLRDARVHRFRTRKFVAVHLLKPAGRRIDSPRAENAFVYCNTWKSNEDRRVTLDRKTVPFTQ